MQTLQLFTPGGMIFFHCLLLLALLVAVAKAWRSCWKAIEEHGWPEARVDILATLVLVGVLVCLLGSAALFLQWFDSRGSYYAISFDRDYLVLRFE